MNNNCHPELLLWQPISVCGNWKIITHHSLCPQLAIAVQAKNMVSGRDVKDKHIFKTPNTEIKVAFFDYAWLCITVLS